jgi:LCP family protein required for cell wall assembly
MQHDSRPQGWSPQVSDDDYIRFLRGESVLGLSSEAGPDAPTSGRRRRRADAPDAPVGPAGRAPQGEPEPRYRRRTAPAGGSAADAPVGPSGVRFADPRPSGGRRAGEPDPFEKYLRQRELEGHPELRGVVPPARRADPPPPPAPLASRLEEPPQFQPREQYQPEPPQYQPPPPRSVPSEAPPRPELDEPTTYGGPPTAPPAFDAFRAPAPAGPAPSHGPDPDTPTFGSPALDGPTFGGPALDGPTFGGPARGPALDDAPTFGGRALDAPTAGHRGLVYPAAPPTFTPPTPPVPVPPLPVAGTPRRRGRHAAPDEGAQPPPAQPPQPPAPPGPPTFPAPAALLQHTGSWPTPSAPPAEPWQQEPWQQEPWQQEPAQWQPAEPWQDATAMVVWPDAEATQLHPPGSLVPRPTDLDEPTEQISPERLAELAATNGAADGAPARPDAAPQTATAGEPRSAARRAATRRPPPRRRARWVRIMAWSGAFVGVLVLALGSYAFYEYKKISGNINRVDALATNDPSIKDAAKQLDAENFLLIGSDTRAGANDRYGGDAVGGQRSDTTILAHLSPDRAHATLISFPRDSWVTIPDCKGANGATIPEHDGMFNSAFETGGANCTIRTMQKLTGVAITHYVQVDFTGFKSMVDAVGGVPVCSTEDVYDHDSGLRLHTGQQTLRGEQALSFVRARHGLGDGSDLDRIKRQQMFLGSMMRVATSNKVLFNPVSLTRFLNAASKSVTLDRQTTLNDLRRLAGQLQGLDPKRVTFLTAPIANRDYDPTGQRTTGGGRVLLDAAQGEILWQSLINDKAAPKATPSAAPKPPTTNTATVTLPPEQVTVRVLNGVGTSGLAGKVGTALGNQGFVLTSTANATGTVTATTIRYAPANREAAITLAAAVPGSVLAADASLDQTLELVVGPTYRGVQPVQLGQHVTLNQIAGMGTAPKPTLSPQPSINAGDTNACA